MIRACSFLTCTAALLFTALSCGGKNPVSVSITGSNSQSFAVPAGSEFTVTLQTIGSGEFISPPSVSSGAVQFLDVSIVGPNEPAGPKQQFRFIAIARGNAVVVFRHTGAGGPEMLPVEDTVWVL